MSSPLLYENHPSNRPEVHRPPEATLLNAPEFCTTMSPEDEALNRHIFTTTLNSLVGNTRRDYLFDGDRATVRDMLLNDPAMQSLSREDLDEQVDQRLLATMSTFKEHREERDRLRQQAEQLMNNGLRAEVALREIRNLHPTLKEQEVAAKRMEHESVGRVRETGRLALQSHAELLRGDDGDATARGRVSAIHGLRFWEAKSDHAKNVARVPQLEGSERELNRLLEVFAAREEAIEQADTLLEELNDTLRADWDLRDAGSIPGTGEAIEDEVRNRFNELTAIVNSGKLLKNDGEHRRLFTESARMLVRIEERGIFSDLLQPGNEKHTHAEYTREGGIKLHEATDREYIAFANGTIGVERSGYLECFDVNGHPVDSYIGEADLTPTDRIADGSPENQARLDELFKTWEETRQSEDAKKLHDFLQRRVNYQTLLDDTLAASEADISRIDRELDDARNLPETRRKEAREKRKLVQQLEGELGATFEQKRTAQEAIAAEEGDLPKLRTSRNKGIYWTLRLEVGNLSDEPEENVQMYTDGAIELPKGMKINGVEVEATGSVILPTGETVIVLPNGRKEHRNAAGVLTRTS